MKKYVNLMGGHVILANVPASENHIIVNTKHDIGRDKLVNILMESGMLVPKGCGQTGWHFAKRCMAGITEMTV